MQAPPWSQNDLKRLGRSIRDGSPHPSDQPSYSDVLVWYNDLSAEVQRVIVEIDWSDLLGDRSVEVTSRAKTVDTLRQKLVRDPSTPLSSVQDIAGVRFEAEMSLDEQDLVAARIADRFDHAPTCIHDLRANPHSGYRAVHLWLRLPSGRVEVQVRTHLQSDWANLYESVADVLGREIRYGEIPKEELSANLVIKLQSMSTEQVVSMEHNRNSSNTMKAAYRSQLAMLSLYDDDDTLPVELVQAQEADARVGELQKIYAEGEQLFRNSMSDIKRMFDELSKGSA